MQVNFRQGIVRNQSIPPFLALSNNGVDLLTNSEPTIFTIAFQETDYLYTENISLSGAWTGPFLDTVVYYLYWDIDMTTGLRTFGKTTINPFLFGTTPPNNPLIGQHFFFYLENTLKVWNGQKWNPVLRVFAGKIDLGNVLIPQPIGTQVNLLQSRKQGHIVFDNNGSPLKNNKGYFLTTETIVNTQNNPLNNYKIEGLQVDGRAIEPVPQYRCVTWKGINKLGLASYVDFKRPSIGVAVENMSKDSVRKFVTDGYVTNPNWNFTVPPNTPVWVGLNGEITPVVPTSWSIQQMGYVVSLDTILLKISPIILLENQITFPTPTPTISITPSVTRTATITPTNTATASLTPTNTPTVTTTQTLTPTPTITPSITPSITFTPTVTFTATTTPTPTVTATFTPTLTGSPTLTPTFTVTPVPTETATQTVTPTATVTITATPTLTPTNTVTASVTVTPTPTVTPTLV